LDVIMDQSAAASGDDGVELQLLLRPNCALTRRQMVWVVGAISSVALGVALVLAFQGLWPILPLAGLECMLLAGAFAYVARGQDDFERVVVDADRVMVTHRHRGTESTHEFPRYWARVVLTHSPYRGHLPRVAIRSHGREAEVGRWMTETGRRQLAVRLKAVIPATAAGA